METRHAKSGIQYRVFLKKIQHIVAPTNHEDAWEEGILPLPPLPNRRMTSSNVRKGRGLPIQSLRFETSNSDKTKPSNVRQIKMRPFVPPFIHRKIITQARRG